MEDFKPQNSVNILKKIEHTGDSLPGTNIEESIARLKQPFKNIEYAGSGSEDINYKEFNYHFSYSSINSKPNPSLEVYIDYIKHKLSDTSDPASEVENWRKLDSLSVNIAGQEFDILKILKENTDVFFCPNSAIDNGIAFKDSGTIAVLGDIASPITLVILLHEMGHIIDFEKMDELGVDKMVDNHPDSDQAEKLRMERVASAFALKVIRPHIKDKTIRHDVINFLKYYALKSYYNGVQDIIRGRRGMRKHAKDDFGDYENIERQEDENRYYYDAWSLWKQTEKYKEWKERPENKEADEYEEYGLWNMWVRDSGYEFWNDIPEEKTQGNIEI